MKNKLLLPLLAAVFLLLGGLWSWLGQSEGSQAAVSVEGVGPGALTPGESVSQLPLLAKPEAKTQRVDSLKTPQQLLTAKDGESPVAIPSNAIWIEGRVLFPEGMPNDTSKVTIIARGRAFGDSSRREYETTANRDGKFRVAFSVETRTGWLDVNSRYLYMPEKLAIKPREVHDEVLLEPEMGGVIYGVASAPHGEEWTEEARAGATILVQSWSGRSRVSRNSGFDSEGGFEIRAIPAGSYGPIIRTPLWADKRVEKQDLRAGESIEIRTQLERGSIVTGRVVDENDVGRGGIAVELTSIGEGWSREFNLTAEDGSFVLRGIPEGEFQVKAAMDERLVAEQELGFLAAGSKREGIVLEVRSGHSIQGFVRWPDGSPAVGASVSVSQDREVSGLTFKFDDSSYEKTGPDGSFEISGLENSECAIRAYAKSFKPADLAKDKKRVKSGKASNLRARGPTYRVRKLGVPAGTRGLELVLDPGDSINGRVLDDEGEGLGRFVIQARPAGGDEFMDKDTVRRVVLSVDGSFSVDGLRPGSWSVRAIADDHEPSQEVTVTLPGSGELEFIAKRLSQISGLVRDPSGEPFSGAGIWVDKLGDDEDFMANVIARSWGEQTRTNRDGKYKASDITPGRLRVWASAEGYGTSEAVLVNVDPGTQVEQVLLQLRLPGRIRGTLHGSIQDRKGRRISINSTGQRGRNSEEALTDGGGDFEVTGLDAGTYRLTLSPSKTNSQDGILERKVAQEVEVADGAVVSVVLGAPPSNPALVTGVVTRAGEPAPRVTVRCQSVKDSDLNNDVTVTGDNGEYSLSLAGAGKYTFYFGDKSSGVIELEQDLSNGENTGVDFELPGSSIRGVVLGLSGEGLGKCDLRLLPVQVDVEGPAAGPQWVMAGEGGQFEFANVAAGTYNLRAYDRQPSRWERRMSRTVTGTQVVEGLKVTDQQALSGVEIQLVEAGEVRGTVTGASGQPVSGAKILVRTLSGADVHGSGRSTTDAQGNFTYRGIGMDQVTVGARKDGKSGEAVKVHVVPGEEVEVHLSLDAD